MNPPRSARELVESGSIAHLVTPNADGSPQVSCVWVGLEQDEIVSGHCITSRVFGEDYVRSGATAKV